MSETPDARQTVIASIDRAREELSRCCRIGFKLRASIPADPERDSDLIIGRALQEARELIWSTPVAGTLVPTPNRLQRLIADWRSRAGEPPADWVGTIPPCCRDEINGCADDLADELAALVSSAPSEEPTLEPKCARCGGPHPYDTVVPSGVIWNAVVRDSGQPDFLCPTCILRAFVLANTSFTATLWGGFFNGMAIEVRVNGAAALDAAALSDENTKLRARIQELETTREIPPHIRARLDQLLRTTLPPDAEAPRR